MWIRVLVKLILPGLTAISRCSRMIPMEIRKALAQVKTVIHFILTMII